MKCALITGGSRGIGRAVAIQLAIDFNLHILINYSSNISAAKETLRLIEENGHSAELMPFDVTDSKQVINAIETWHQNNPEKYIDVLVNNAGVINDNIFPLITENNWDIVVDTSLKGMFNCTQAVIQQMLRKRSGRIINIVSLSGLKGVPGQTNYAAAKGGVIAATKSLSQEVAKRNITINAIAPGFISTDMTSHLDEETLKKMIPANRFGKPEEVAYLASFLASDKASYINGEIININGGIYS